VSSIILPEDKRIDRNNRCNKGTLLQRCFSLGLQAVYASWRRDGKAIVYASNRDGTFDIWIHCLRLRLCLRTDRASTRKHGQTPRRMARNDLFPNRLGGPTSCRMPAAVVRLGLGAVDSRPLTGRPSLGLRHISYSILCLEISVNRTLCSTSLPEASREMIGEDHMA
jgi:hypothetical protein